MLAASALDLVVTAGEAVCLSEGAGLTPSPPPSPTISSLTSEGSSMFSLLKHFLVGPFRGKEFSLISPTTPSPSPVASGSFATPPKREAHGERKTRGAHSTVRDEDPRPRHPCGQTHVQQAGG